MAEIVTILDIVSRGTKLALDLYEFGAAVPTSTDLVHRVAKQLGQLNVALKQVGGSIKDDDTIPSPAALETIREITQQCHTILREIETMTPLNELSRHADGTFQISAELKDWKWGMLRQARMEYLLQHLESLKATCFVMLQTFLTVNAIRWTLHQSISTPHKAQKAIDNEKMQMRALITEQQLCLIKLKELHTECERRETLGPARRKLLTNNEDLPNSTENSASPSRAPSPMAMVKYQEPTLVDFKDTSSGASCMFKVQQVSLGHVGDVIKRWTRLSEIEERLNDGERDKQSYRDEAQWERRQKQQATVESDHSDEELLNLPGFRRKARRLPEPTPNRPPSVLRAFSEGAPPIPIPNPNMRNGHPLTPISPYRGTFPVSPSNNVYPISPASSFKSSWHSARSSFNEGVVDRTHLAGAKAAIAAQAIHDDDSTGLQIPWKLCTRTNYWMHVDNKVKDSNTEAPVSQAYVDRGSAWTEILASWVCREALEAAHLDFDEVHKERRDGRRTRLDKCFVIRRALEFSEVERLVETTIDIVKENLRRNSQDSNHNEHRSQQPPKITSQPASNIPVAAPPPLTMARSLSYGGVPPNQPTPSIPKNPYVPVLGTPVPQHQQQQQHQQPQPYLNPFPPSSPTANPHYNRPPLQPQDTFSPTSPSSRQPNSTFLDPAAAAYNRTHHRSSSFGANMTNSPQDRNSYRGNHPSRSPSRRVLDTPSNSDSDSDAARKDRRRRERASRDRDRDRDRDRGRDKERYEGGSSRRRTMLGTLAKVGGLTALLDGL